MTRRYSAFGEQIPESAGVVDLCSPSHLADDHAEAHGVYHQPFWSTSFSEGRNTSNHLGEAHHSPIFFRPLCPADYHTLRLAHQQAFPVDYEDAFFQRAVAPDVSMLTWAAVQRQGGQESLVGFITAKYLRLFECDPTDRAIMGLGSRLLDAQEVAYILTLGVAEGVRRQGVAGQLLQLVLSAARARRCRACFLHVISYNHAAISFYLKRGFSQLVQLRDFYFIASGRQVDPVKTNYDAFLFAQHLQRDEALPAMAYVNTALVPFRNLMDSWLGACGACGTWMQPAARGVQCSSSHPHSRSSLAQQHSWLYKLFSRHAQ